MTHLVRGPPSSFYFVLEIPKLLGRKENTAPNSVRTGLALNSVNNYISMLVVSFCLPLYPPLPLLIYVWMCVCLWMSVYSMWKKGPSILKKLKTYPSCCLQGAIKKQWFILSLDKNVSISYRALY